MTIVVEVEDHIRAQVIKQMNKLVNVLQASEMTGDRSVCREMILLHTRPSHHDRAAVLKEAEIFGARVVDSSTDGFALEVTGDTGTLEEFIGVMKTYGEIAVSIEARILLLQPPVPTRAALRQEEMDGVPNA